MPLLALCVITLWDGEMKERPILFSAPMVRAILDGRKTQTRRQLYVPTKNLKSACLDRRYESPSSLQPMGEVWTLSGWSKVAAGDKLWVRESFSGPYVFEAQYDVPASPPRDWPPSTDIHYWADGDPEHGDWTVPRPSIHMPRWASRITLEVTGVRVKRVREMFKGNDLEAEGISQMLEDCDSIAGRAFNHAEHYSITGAPGMKYTPEEYGVAAFWDSINGQGNYDSNPWVVAIEFRKEPT